MKNHRFPWLRNRTTDNRKCEKACNIKEKRTIEMFSTASKPLVAHLSSASAEFPFFKDFRPMAVVAVMGLFLLLQRRRKPPAELVRGKSLRYYGDHQR